MKGECAKCVTDLEEVKAEAEAQKRKKRSRSPKTQKDKGSEWCQQTSRKTTETIAADIIHCQMSIKLPMKLLMM